MSTRVRQPGRHERDAGMTLVELVVAMGLFTLLVGVVMGSVVATTRSAVRSDSATSAQADVNRAFNLLDKQVRYADAINLAGTSAGVAYVEFRSTAPTDAVPRCYQWRYDPSSGQLGVRSWAEGAAVSTGAWQTVLTTAPNAATQPFTTVRTTPDSPRQQLRVQLRVDGAAGARVVLDTAFVARNSTPGSLGNQDSSPADGVSDQPVCAPPGYRS